MTTSRLRVKQVMKRLIHRFLNARGYELHRSPRSRRRDDLYGELYSADSVKGRRFYNIGAGGFSHVFWTNVDHDSDWYTANRAKTLQGIQHDLLSLEPLPIEDDSAEIVYSSHVVEHISNVAAQHMFKEVHRILKPNGFFRITTPNIDLGYRAYRENDRHYFYWIDMYSIGKEWERVKYTRPLNRASTAQIFLAHFATSVSTLHSDGAPERIDDDALNALFKKSDYEEALDYCISKCPTEIQKRYPGNHMNWWNFKKCSLMLRKAGFSKIYLSGYGQSFCPILRNTAYFDNTHPAISLYVEAVK